MQKNSLGETTKTPYLLTNKKDESEEQKEPIWKSSDRELRVIYQRIWRKKNPQKYAEYQKRACKKYVATHRKQFNDSMRDWRKRNPEKLAKIQHRNYIRRRNSGKIPSISKRDNF